MSTLFHTRRVTGVAMLAFLLTAIGFAAGGLRIADSAPGNPADTILVAFDTSANEAAVAALIEAEASSEVEAIPALGLKVLRVPPGQDAADLAARFARHPLVRFAEPNDSVYPDVIANDPYYSQAWHLPKIEAPAAWDGPKATGVLIAVCDTGVFGGHEDLAPILRGDLGWNAASNSTDWSPVQGHGTLVAGAAAAATNNSTGVSGVAWGAQVIPVRITNNTDGTAYVSDAVKCIQGSADRGARVINLSYRMASYSAIDTAAAYARSRGAITFVSAGNDGLDPGWQDFPNFLAVAATSDFDTRMSWSNYGAYVDIAAPGNSIRTTRSDGAYTWASGTSLASPLAAGVAALIFGANPGLSADGAEAILRQSAEDIGDAGEDAFFGSGRVNARRAVELALGGSSTPPPPPADTTPPAVSVTAPANGSSVAGMVMVSASASDNAAVTGVEFWLDGQLQAATTSSPYAIAWDSATVSDGWHNWTARAFDAAGNTSEASVMVAAANAGSTPDPTPSPEPSPSPTPSPAPSPAPSPEPTPSPTPEPAPQPVTETFTGRLGGKNQPANRSHSISTRVDGPMTVVLSWGGKARLQYTIYNATGQAIQGGAVSGQTVTVSALPAGSYTVVVSLVSGQANYTLGVTHY